MCVQKAGESGPSNARCRTVVRTVCMCNKAHTGGVLLSLKGSPPALLRQQQRTTCKHANQHICQAVAALFEVITCSNVVA